MKKIILHISHELPFEVREAVNRLRVNLGFCGEQYKKIMISSSVPGEGKSFVAYHLWKMLAEAGKRVVYVDADMRKSMVRSKYRIQSADKSRLNGLSHYLSGQTPLDDVLFATNIPNAYMIPTVKTVSNAPVLLQNKLFPDLLDRLAANFDYVIVDTPPLVNVADGGSIAASCDGSVLVVRYGNTPKSLIRISVDQIQKSDCQILGMVLNRSEKIGNSYYSKYSKYGYGSYGS